MPGENVRSGRAAGAAVRRRALNAARPGDSGVGTRVYAGDLLRGFMSSLGADAAAVLHKARGGEWFEFYEVVGVAIPAGVRVSGHGSLTALAGEARAALVIDDLSQMTKAPPALSSRFASAVLSPMRIEDRFIGFVAILSRERARFNQETVRVLEQTSRVLAALLDREHLLREAKLRQDVIDSFGAVTALDAADLSGRAYLRALLERARLILGADAAGVLSADSAAEWLTLSESVGSIAPAGLKISAAEGFVGRAVRSREAVNVPDLAAESPRVPGLAAGFASAVAVPLYLEGLLVGVMAIASREPRHFTSDQASMLLGAAGRFALLMDRQRIQAEARELSSGLLAADEAARESLAFDLHDRAAQTAAYGLMLLDAFSASYRPRRPEARAMIGELRDQVEVTLTELRSLISELKSPATGGGDLLRDLQTSLKRFAAAHGVRLDLEVRLLQPVDDGVLVQAYRIAQEAVNNAVKHSGAPAVRARISSDFRGCRVRVEDGGRGFEPRGDYSGVGLAAMRARALHVGGSLTIDSSPGQGTRVIARLPLKPVSPEAPRPARGAPGGGMNRGLP
jgi:signal transduction histidine kinase